MAWPPKMKIQFIVIGRALARTRSSSSPGPQTDNSVDRCNVGARWYQIVVMAWPPNINIPLIVVMAWPPKMKIQSIIIMAWPPNMKIQLIVVMAWPGKIKNSVDRCRGLAAQNGNSVHRCHGLAAQNGNSVDRRNDFKVAQIVSVVLTLCHSCGRNLQRF